MERVAASLAAVAFALGLSACGGDGAEPGASREATLVLDFTPNAAHAGIYAADELGYYAQNGIDLEIREPSASTDAPKLLQAGRADFAVMDINDIGIARERGADVSAIAPIVNRPLASVIAVDPAVKRPRDLEGGTVGVTGLPSDDAVLDSVLEADGADPDAVKRVTIGFDAVAALAAGRVDAATAFWNAEGVALAEEGVDTTEFRVDDFGAPTYPELMLVARGDLSAAERQTAAGMVRAVSRGSAAVRRDPEVGLEALLNGVDGLDETSQRAQLEALADAGAFPRPTLTTAGQVADWAHWAIDHGIVEPSPELKGVYG